MTVRPAPGVCLAGLLLLLLTACAGAQPGTVTPPQGDTPVREDAAAGSLRVGLTEWTVVTSADAAEPGRIRMRVTNAGATDHDLVVQGAKGEWRTHSLAPGEVTSLTVHAKPSEVLQLWCDEPGHRSQGMHATLRIRPG